MFKTQVAEVLQDHEVDCTCTGLHDLILLAIDAPDFMKVPKSEDSEPADAGVKEA